MNVTTSIKLDSEIKRQAQEVAKASGLTLSALINSYLTQVVATRRIELYAPEPMSPKLEGLVAEVEKQIATGEISQTFDNADEFIADLKK
ncbi:MAG: type II toxin-antitoxin system RelB/DinJ family antitoxin [Candidatus Saccharibacteria bacterium]|nr:type II toxin-antitoxin system RelB/DinJ family antitoxin [Candidatus Saccharibacteria bacterium]